MVNKERLSHFNRSNILLSAKTLFLEKGIASTTVDDIAKEADCSKSTIYVYFKGKEDIYNHLLLEHMQIQKKMIVEALRKSPGFPEGYFAICSAMVEFYEAYPLFFEGILNEIELPKNEPESILVQIFDTGEEINGILEEYIRECVDRHRISLNTTPLQTSFTLWAGISGLITLADTKELYIQKAMGITKEKFMQDGFALLLKSIEGDCSNE